jgi:hypothetical protein
MAFSGGDHLHRSQAKAAVGKKMGVHLAGSKAFLLWLAVEKLPGQNHIFAQR